MICSRTCSLFAAGCLILFLDVSARQATAGVAITYNQNIRPILSDNCFSCHGPDRNKRKAKLRLDVREDAVAKKAIVPGKSEESELVRRIFSSDPDELMPPPKSQKKLSAPQKELLRQWISDGAEYQKHWAYLQPLKPATPQGSEGLDYLVRQHLSNSGLKPSPAADRRTLIRRLYFDLIGLPPKPEEVDAFEADSSADAYGKVVERLLASPAYGERMAIGWLDVVRYADTIGYHSDNPRNVWPYRDYVIRSFNQNKPFDEFTREQLAGDLLPHSTLEQCVASGFNRLLLSTEEGGAQPKDYEARMLTDRVRAVSTVWLAQTFGCSQCHDHKFDPITQRDFYSLGAFFADLQEPIIGRREDGLLVPTKTQTQELTRLDAVLTRTRKRFETAKPELVRDWEDSAVKAVLLETNWSVLHPEEAIAESKTKLSVDPDGIVQSEKNPARGVDVYRIKTRLGTSNASGFRLEVLPSDRLPAHGPGRAPDGGFALTGFEVDSEGHSIELASAEATYEASDSAAITAIASNAATNQGWTVHGLAGIPQAIYFRVQEPFGDPETEITLTLKQARGDNEVMGRFRLSVTQNPEATQAPKATLPPNEIVEILKVARPFRTAEQKEKLAAYHRGIAPELADLREEVANAQKRRDEYEGTIPRCLVSNAMEKPRTVRILPRGNWMIESGEVVEPSLPGYLAGTNRLDRTKSRLDRLDLANWLIARDNPLTARVFVNRLWKQFFGIGISKILDDFGAQGESPANPALLDWLACEFMESGWDVKHMVRLLVSSQTYQQASSTSKDLEIKDPYNRELARQSRWRLDAELVRDNALSIAGLLTTRLGGPSSKPYQPEGYWENLNFPVRTYEASKGADQYRRGLYTWWQRSYMHPSLLAFDAPTREECTADRTRSNIPQQALVLLNDPTYVEAARAFAARILAEGGTSTQAKIQWAWRQALDRAPRSDEAEAAESLLSKSLAEYREKPQDADALLKVGEFSASNLDPTQWAAWTQVARVLLNLHETITRS